MQEHLNGLLSVGTPLWDPFISLPPTSARVQGEQKDLIYGVFRHRRTSTDPVLITGGQGVAGSNPDSPTEDCRGFSAAEVGLVKGIEACDYPAGAAEAQDCPMPFASATEVVGGQLALTLRPCSPLLCGELVSLFLGQVPVVLRCS